MSVNPVMRSFIVLLLSSASGFFHSINQEGPHRWDLQDRGSRTESATTTTATHSCHRDVKVRAPQLKADGILYRTSVLNKDDFQAIAQQASFLSAQLHDESSSIAVNRLGVSLAPQSPIARILDSGLQPLVQKVAGPDYILSPHFPVELRVYQRHGAGMAWHVDDILYDPPQLEVVWTLENTSDCATLWKDSQGNLHRIETDPNSAILLTAGVAPHCVTSLKRGKRVILKCAYVQQGACFDKEQFASQFPTQQNNRIRQKQKRR